MKLFQRRAQVVIQALSSAIAVPVVSVLPIHLPGELGLHTSMEASATDIVGRTIPQVQGKGLEPTLLGASRFT